MAVLTATAGLCVVRVPCDPGSCFVFWSCAPGSKLIEIGFRSPMTRHYSHAAAALKMKYELVLLAPDSRGVGAPQVTLDGMTTPDMIAARVAGFLTSLTSAHAAAGQTAEAKEEL